LAIIIQRLIQNNNPSEEELRQRLLQRYPGGIQPRNNAQQNENELRQRLLQRYPRGIAKRVNDQVQNNPPPPQNEPPPAPQQPGIVQSNDFPRGRDRSRTKNDLPRNNLNPQIQNVAVAAPVVANQAFEYPAFLKEHHPHRWNKTSFSFKEPPETIRPYYFIDRYFNHIRNPTNLAISQSTLPNAGLGLFAFLPNNLKINGAQTIVFHKDDRIDEYNGIPIRSRIKPGRWLNKTAQQQVEERPKDYYLMINKDFYIDAEPVDSCYVRYCNDNKDVEDGNNAIFEKEAHPTVSLRDKCYVVALRDIKVDEEIFVSYGDSYWNETQVKVREVQTVYNNAGVSSSSSAQQQPKQKKRRKK